MDISPADGTNAAFEIAGLRHVPWAARRVGYTTCSWGWKGLVSVPPDRGVDRQPSGQDSVAKVTRLANTLLYIYSFVSVREK